MNHSIKIDPALFETPTFKLALQQTSGGLEELDHIISLVIEKTQNACQIATELNSAYLSVVREITRLKTLYRLDQASDDQLLKDCVDFGKDDKIHNFVGVLSSLAQFLVDMQCSLESKVTSLKEQFLEPLIDFQNKSHHLEKNAKKLYEKSSDDYETSLAKYLSASRKKPNVEAALQLYNTKANWLKANHFYASSLNSINLAKEDIFLHGIKIVFEVLSSNADAHAGADLIDALRMFKSSADTKEAKDLNLSPASLKNADFEQMMKDFEKELKLSSSNIELKDDPVLSEVSKSGYLWVRGKGPMKSWSRKYCRIKYPPGHFCTLSKGKSNLAEEVIADLLVSKCNEIEVDDRNWTFEITTSSGTQYFQAESEKQFAAWMNSIFSVQNIVSHNVHSSAQSKLVSGNDDKRKAVYAKLSERNDSLGNMSYTSFKSSDEDLVISGFLGMKQFKAPRRLSIGSKDYSDNSTWRTVKLELLSNGKLFQQLISDGKRQNMELLDLKSKVTNRYHIQSVDESLFNKKNCILINCSDGKLFYLATNSYQECNAWLNSLKEALQGYLPGKDGKMFRAYRKLTLRIIEARGLHSSSDYYCEIFFGFQLKARTNVRSKTSGEPFWREEFVFDDIHSLRQGVSIVLVEKSKYGKESETGRVYFDSTSIKNGETESWLQLSGGDSSSSLSLLSNANSNESSGEIKLRIKFEEEVILSSDQYDELRSIFSEKQTPIVYDLAQVSPDLEYISAILLNIYDSSNSAVEWLTFLLENEIGNTENTAVLFRGNSLLTKAMDTYMKVCCQEYLEETLGDVLREICELKPACEIDPTRLEPKEDSGANFQRLKDYAAKIWSNIRSSVPKLPRELRFLFARIVDLAKTKFSLKDNEKSVYTAVTGFLFLRLLCPAILNPKLFRLCRDFPDTKTSRTFTLLAKILQCLGNLASFGMKEDYMIAMNSFLMDNSAELMEFIESICNVTELDASYAGHKIDEEKQFSTLHRFIRTQSIDIYRLSQQYQNAANELKKSQGISDETSSSISASEEDLQHSLNIHIFVPPNSGPKIEHLEQRAEQLKSLLKVCDVLEQRVQQKLS